MVMLDAVTNLTPVHDAPPRGSASPFYRDRCRWRGQLCSLRKPRRPRGAR